MLFRTRMKEISDKSGNLPSGPFNQSRVPINRMPAARGTQWPVENRPNNLHVYPESRTYKGIFRRYPNGTLDYMWATGQVEEAVRKFGKGIPLTENEALATSAVFPEIEFHGLPKSIVKSKAALTEQEVLRIQKTLSSETVDTLFSMGAKDF